MGSTHRQRSQEHCNVVGSFECASFVVSAEIQITRPIERPLPVHIQSHVHYLAISWRSSSAVGILWQKVSTVERIELERVTVELKRKQRKRSPIESRSILLGTQSSQIMFFKNILGTVIPTWQFEKSWSQSFHQKSLTKQEKEQISSYIKAYKAKHSGKQILTKRTSRATTVRKKVIA